MIVFFARSKNYKSYFSALFIIFFILSNQSFAAIGSPSVGSSGSDLTRSFSENQYGYGLFASYEFSLLKGVTTLVDDFTSIMDEDDESKVEEPAKPIDKVFSSIDLFYNYYGDGLDQNYGLSYSLGYAYKKFSIFASGGYVKTDFDYQEGSNSQSISEGSGFVGGGLSYNITENIKTKLSFMSYNVGLAPENSVYNKVKVAIRTTNLSVGYSF